MLSIILSFGFPSAPLHHTMNILFLTPTSMILFLTVFTMVPPLLTPVEIRVHRSHVAIRRQVPLTVDSQNKTSTAASLEHFFEPPTGKHLLTTNSGQGESPYSNQVITGITVSAGIVNVIVPIFIIAATIVSLLATIVVTTSRTSYQAFVTAASFSDVSQDGPVSKSQPNSSSTGMTRSNRYEANSLPALLADVNSVMPPSDHQQPVSLGK